MRFSTINQFVMAVLAVSLFGCGTTKGYDGPEKPSSELAMVVGARYGGTNYFSRDARWIAFTQVDDKTVGNAFMGYPENVNLIAGKHTIKVIMLEKYPAGMTSTPGTNSAMAEAGAIRWPSASFVFDASTSKHYIVKFVGSSAEKIPFKAWVEEENSGIVVAGSKPSNELQ
jgi:hypothetical protein